jgi:hypothetical protein
VTRKKKPKFKKIKPVLTLDELIRRAEEWDSRYLEATVHALELYDRADVYDLEREFLSKRNRGAFKLTNPHSKRLWIPKLIESFLNSRQQRHGRSWDEDLRDSKVAVGFVTFTHRAWACADSNIRFDFKRAKQKVRNALAGTSFIANFEAAVYRNEPWVIGGKEGKLICFHCHALVWAGSLSGLRRLQQRIQGRFDPMLGNENGVHLREVHDEDELARSLVYLTKVPTLGYRTTKTKSGKKRQAHAKMTFSSRRNLFHALKDRSTFDFWLAGGEGRRVLSIPRSQLRKKYKPAHSSGRGGPRHRNLRTRSGW